MEGKISIKLTGPAVENGRVSFKLLAELLNGIQQTMYYIGMAELKKEPRTKGRIPQTVIQACELYRVVESPGSYEIVAEVPYTQDTMFSQDISSLGITSLQKMFVIIKSIEQRNEALIQDIVPDGEYRRRILRSIEAFCPREGDEWVVSIKQFSYHRNEVTLTQQSRRLIMQWLSPPEFETMTVTGELVRIHLDEHKLGILYPPTGRVLDCFYSPELDDFLIQNLKGYVHVTGRVQLDNQGNPDKIIDVTEVSSLDLSPLRISRISAGGLALFLTKPLYLEPSFFDQSVVLEYEPFNIIADGITREEAINNFEKDFVWLWKEYVQTEDELLTLDAAKLKRELLALVKEVHNAEET